MVVHGEDGLDEVSVSAEQRFTIKGGDVENFFIGAEDFGLWRNKIDSYRR